MEFEFFLEDGDLLEAIQLEALFNKIPDDIKKLRKDMGNYIVDLCQNELDRQKQLSTKERFKNNLNTSRTESIVLNNINKMLSKFGVKEYGFNTSETYINGASMRDHEIIGTYKGYVIAINIGQPNNTPILNYPQVYVKYDDSECNIPKNVVFDILHVLDPLDKVKSTENSVTFKPYYSDSIKSKFEKIESKYGNKYDIKKNFGGGSMTISMK